ncbi:hypothetical protein EU546_01895, partial [Candidatus Thorarchaeota archaeon]
MGGFKMRRQRVLVLILVTLFAFSLIDLSGHGEPTDSLLPTSNPSDWSGIADDGTSYFGTGSPLTVTFSGTFTNSSSWSEVDTTLSSEFAPGTSFVVTNASTVTWSAYILVSPPAEVESLGLMVDYFGTEWKPTSLTNPVGTSMSYPSQWWYDADMVYVSESAVTTYGVWKLDFTAMNHLSDLQLGEVGASLGSSATFDISDEMLFRGTSSWIAGATTEFALTDPTGATWHTATNTTPGSSTHVLQSFRYKKDITVDRSRHLSASLTNFPVMVRLVDTDLHDKVQADGDDIAFYAGGKIVPHEIELFDQDFTGTEALLIAWVKVNLTGSANTVISMYYGNPYLGPQERPDEVWTQNFGAVWHLNEDTTAGGTSAIHYDSTSNNHFGNQSGNEDDTGQIGLGQRFDGSNDQIVISSDRNFAPSGDVEISGWFKLDSSFGSSSPTTRLIFTKYLDGDNDMHIALVGQDYDHAGIPTGSLVFKVENNAAGQKYKYTTRTSWTAGTWYHFSCFVDSDTPENNEIWINGSDNTGGTDGLLASADVAYDANWGIGGGLIEQVSGLLSYFDGVIDEVRVSTTLRGQAWKSASYSNQLNPS